MWLWWACAVLTCMRGRDHTAMHQDEAGGCQCLRTSHTDAQCAATTTQQQRQVQDYLQHDHPALLKATYCQHHRITPKKPTWHWLWCMTLKFNRAIAVVKERVPAKFHQAVCSGLWAIVLTQKKTRTKTIRSVATTRTVINSHVHFSLSQCTSICEIVMQSKALLEPTGRRRWSMLP